MALVAHLTDTNSLSEYHQSVNNRVQASVESCLELNISKTKELCCRSRRKLDAPQPLFEAIRLDGQLVEQVDTFKYLETELDTFLSFSQHAGSVYKKAQQHLLSKLKTFNPDKDFLTLVYMSLILYSPSIFHLATITVPLNTKSNSPASPIRSVK